MKSPHVGWNQIEVNNNSRLLKRCEQRRVCLLHTFFRAPVVEETVACTSYGGAFSAAVERENVFGVQFHPEKSAETGLKILENFCAL